MTPGMERLWILAYRWERRLQRSADWCVETPWLPRWPCWPLANALNALSAAPHDWCVRYPAYRRRCLAHWSQRLTVLAQDRRDARCWTGITEAFGTLGRRHRMTLADVEETEHRAHLIVRRTYTALQHEGRDPAWSQFIAILTGRAEEAGRRVIAVDPRGTSQTCLCGARAPKTLADR